MTRRYRQISVNVDVDVVLNDIDTDVLIEELRARGRDGEVEKASAPHDHTHAIERALHALHALDRGDRLTAMDELRNALDPYDVAKAYEAARAGKHPFLTVRPQ